MEICSEKLTFGQWQMLRAVYVETNGHENETVKQQCCLPEFTDIGVGFDEKNQALNHTSELDAARRNSSNPSEATTPSDDV